MSTLHQSSLRKSVSKEIVNKEIAETKWAAYLVIILAFKSLLDRNMKMQEKVQRVK